MSVLAFLLSFLALMFLSATFSGSETGVYTVSRIHLDAEARRGGRTARLLRYLLSHDAALLITLLIGNNLALELLTDLARLRLERLVSPAALEVVVALSLTPFVFVFGELLPKDVFRRRPRFFLGLSSWLVATTRVVFLPLALPLQWLSIGLERLLGVRESELTRALGREEVLEFLRLGTSKGALESKVEELARNVFVMRTTPVTRVMVPWERVVRVELHDPQAGERVMEAELARLPVVETLADGTSVVRGYVHQIDVLQEPEGALEAVLRPLPALDPATSVDRALAKMQLAGVRIALVGDPEAPLGLLATMDLAALIAGVRAA